jgi:glycosyltransferase involved in cell wall biosynthesis
MAVETPRILIVSRGHPTLVAGGDATAAHDLFCGLNESAEAEAHFLGCVADLRQFAAGDSVLTPYDGLPNEYLLHVGDFDPFMLGHGIDSRSLDDFGHLLDTIKPHIVHFHHLNLIGAECLALVRNRLPQARIVFTLHDFHPICHRDGLMMRTRTDSLCERESSDACHACFSDISPARFSLRRDHLRNMLGLVDRFTAPSDFLRQRFDDWGISRQMIELIPNGLPETVRSLAGDDRQCRNRFGFFGTMTPHKGPLVALDAVTHLDPAIDLTLTLHGTFQFQNATFSAGFDHALERAGDRAHFFGPYSRQNVAECITAMDWIIVPSIWWEAAPLTILESFRVGRPVITSDVGGMAEMIDHGVNGFLFRHNDAADLARVMAMAAGDPELWQRMFASLPTVPTMTRIAARHMALYSDLITQTHKRTA